MFLERAALDASIYAPQRVVLARAAKTGTG